MRIQPPALKSGLVALLVALFTACAGQPEDPDPDQALFRIENNTSEQVLTVTLEPTNGTAQTLGRVVAEPRGERTKNFVTQLPDRALEYRLVAIDEDDSNGERFVSETFVVKGGATVNWYIQENRIEVSN